MLGANRRYGKWQWYDATDDLHALVDVQDALVRDGELWRLGSRRYRFFSVTLLMSPQAEPVSEFLSTIA